MSSAAVELPLTSIEDDVAATVAVLDRFGRPAVLVGHSYGGAVVTAAGAHPHVAHLLYLAAFQLAEGESVGRTLPERDIPPTGLGDALRFSGDGEQVSIDPALATGLFYADAPAIAAAAAVARLRPVARAVFRGVPATIGWRQHALHLRRVPRRPGRAPRPAAGHGRARDHPPRVARRPLPCPHPPRRRRRPHRHARHLCMISGRCPPIEGHAGPPPGGPPGGRWAGPDRRRLGSCSSCGCSSPPSS